MELPAQAPVRLNLGAGDMVVDGWVSVGLEPHHTIRADVRTLPLPDASADELMAIHVLEHIDRWEAPATLAEWARVLKPGGSLTLELPDLLKCCWNVLHSDDPRRGVLGLFGDPADREPLMMHRWGWQPDELRKELKRAGFRSTRTESPKFHGRKAYRDMRVVAFK